MMGYEARYEHIILNGHVKAGPGIRASRQFCLITSVELDVGLITESMTRLVFATPFGVLTPSATSVVAHLFRTAGLLLDHPRAQY